jgi:hypothetical protein
VSNSLRRVRRFLSREPEDVPHRWILLLVGGSMMFLAVLLLTEDVTDLMAYGMLAIALAAAASWLRGSLPARYRGAIVALRIALLVVAIMGLVLLTLGFLFPLP